MKRNQSGFTLIEIAIVLVIIGLLLGGVLKGTEMINQAKIKNAIADFNGIQAAYYGYQDRFRVLPGDDSGATARWGAGVASGDGNGILNQLYNNALAAAALPTGANENNLFWQHMRAAGFIPGPTTGSESGRQPTNALSGMLGVETAPGGAVASGLGLSGLIICSANLPAKIAMAVDTQLDDGDAKTGQVRGQLQTGGQNPATKGTPVVADNYLDNGANQYLVCKAL